MDLNNDKKFRIKRRSIRASFYVCFLFSVLILSLTLSFLYTRSLRTHQKATLAQISTSIVDGKKRFIRNAVERTLLSIDMIREHLEADYKGRGLPKEERDALIRQKIAGFIRVIKLIDDGYLWINHILDYNGGEGYAIRLVHPNLPHTEGLKLSTSTQDIKGNLPYQEELDGIKEHGELFFDYYFKKKTSDKIAHKLSFAKLYKPYNWVVATGVYLDDVDELIKVENKKIENAYRRQQLVTLSTAMAIVLLSGLAIFFFERRIFNLISKYEEKNRCYTAELEKLSKTDRLTGLYNRLMLDEVFSCELDQAKRYNKKFSIAILDLDKFKNINDRYGHQAGDKVLMETAEILQATCRSVDTIGRWGGEEFLIIFPETGLEGALEISERIRRAVMDHAFSVGEMINCSIGVSFYQQWESKEQMVERADSAMYRAKSKGRNRVESG